VLEQIQQSEDQVAENWKDVLLKAPENMEALMDTMFYMDDLQKEVEKYEKVYELIDAYNTLKREFQLDENTYFEEEGQVILAWIDRLRSFPYAVRDNVTLLTRVRET
jgi:hypothetical protein